MKVVSGWHCPDLLSGPGNYQNKTVDSEEAIAFAPGLRTCVQAGGHIGTWPAYLAERFAQVYTFEPDHQNFTCLVRNTEKFKNVFAARGCLGRRRGCRGLQISEKSTGQHFMKGGGIYPVLRIDDFEFTDCDAIFLDVEGAEIGALMGAVKTIDRCKPVIMCEENRRCQSQGYEIGDLEKHLNGMGYVLRSRIHEDLIFSPR